MADIGLRVLMVGPFPRDVERVVGGVEAATHAIASALSLHPDVEKVLVATIIEDGGPASRQSINDKLEVAFLQPPFLTADTLLQSWQLVPGVRRLARSFRPHVVHGQGLGRQGRVAVGLGYPTAITVHGLVNVEARLAAKGLAGWGRAQMAEASVRGVLGRADAVISISDYDARELGDLVKSPRFSIPNAVPAEFFDADFTRPRKPNSILFGGVMRARKNVLGLVNAFAAVRAQLPDASLRIAGPIIEPDYLAKVESRIRELNLGDAVTLLGHVSNEDLIDAMASASVLALFSYEETLPTVIAQAMATGTPVVASDVGGIGEMVIDGETGWKVAPGDEGALAARLLEVLKAPDLAREMGARGRAASMARFAASAVANNTVAAYRAALAQNARR